MKKLPFSQAGDYNELRYHEHRKRMFTSVNGNLITNTTSHSIGESARVLKNGYWGFASSSVLGQSHELSNLALKNAHALQVFGAKDHQLPNESYQGEHAIIGKPILSAEYILDWIKSVESLISQRYPSLTSVAVTAGEDLHSKSIQNSIGSDVYYDTKVSFGVFNLTVEDKDGKPVSLVDYIGGKGTLADHNLSLSIVEEKLDTLHEHLMAKREAIFAKAGLHTIILSPDMAGILAHEAMGHPCEADLVLGGSVTGDLRHQAIASEKVSIVDFAHSYKGRELDIPVYADDEGCPADDVTLIENGILKDFMHNRETAEIFQNKPTGNARAYAPSDEPLIRMRNTAVLPGKDVLEDMIADIEDGYYLLKTSNGQADTTTEFMFGVSLGYEIKNGKIGRAIKDTTLSGSAIKMLKTVDAVSDNMEWSPLGYCGKKQVMNVSMGGPYLRATAQLGGE